MFSASSIPSCPNKGLEEFNSCLIDVLYGIKPQLASGNFGDGVTFERLEPLYTAALAVDTAELKINMSDSNIVGSTTFNVTSVK